MKQPAIAAFVLASTAVLGGCNTHPAGVVAVGSHPNPPPPSGYAAECVSIALPLYNFAASCRPVAAPATRLVVRAKG